MPDIDLFGVTYIQQIEDVNQPTQGLHVEPGVWANVPEPAPGRPPSYPWLQFRMDP
jgi:hypothetical protein